MRDEQAQRGAVLGMVIIAAIVFGVTAFAILSMSLGRTQTTRRMADRTRARYAAEGAIVWAMQQLWANPNFGCPGGPPATVPPAVLSDLGVPAITVEVTNCGVNNMHEIRARVGYQWFETDTL